MTTPLDSALLAVRLPSITPSWPDSPLQSNVLLGHTKWRGPRVARVGEKSETFHTLPGMYALWS